MAVMTIAVPYDWLPNVPHSLIENEDTPLFGYSPPFPWGQLAEAFAKIFQLKSVKFAPAVGQNRLRDNLFDGIESIVLPLFFDFSPMNGTLCFVMSEQEVNHLMNLILLGSTDAFTVVENDYRAGFYRFLALELSNIFMKLDYIKDVIPHLIEQSDLPNATSFCQDIAIEINGIPFFGRIIVSEELRKSWKQRFAERSLTAKIPANLSSKIQTIVHLEAGSVVLQRSEWDEVAPGDCLLLDQCTLEGDGEKGRVIMTLNGNPLFRAKVKDGNLKILESPFFHEVKTQIGSQATSIPTPPSPPPQEAKLADTFDEEFSSFEDEFSEFDDIESAPPEKPATSKTKETATAVGEDTEDKEDTEVSASTEDDESQDGPKVALGAPAGPLSIADIPMTVVVEVGRVQISVQKLMDLEPGNLLELNIHPENGVDLVVNGVVIAKGELLKIGDSLGVRILDKA